MAMKEIGMLKRVAIVVVMCFAVGIGFVGYSADKQSAEQSASLFEAAVKNNALDAQRFINEGIDVNAKGDYGKTALMYAAECNSVDVAKLLIKAKADVNAKDIEGKTALMYTAEYNSADVAELFIKAKADINAKDNDGYTALKYAMDGGYPDIVQLIKEANTKGAKQKNKKAELSLDDMIDKFMKNGAYVKEYDRNTVSYVQKSTLNGIEITKTRVKFYTGPHSLEFNSSKDRISLDKNNNLIIIKQ